MLSPLINTGDERAELQAALRWDYSQLGDAAATVIEHTIEIKRNERRANDAVVAAGRHLIAVKETLAHGQWGDWLDTEFNMSDRTARTLMSIAERFDGKTEMISDLSVTVLGLLAAPSTPDAAVDAVIAANQQQPVRVADVKAIIADHRPTVDPWQSAATANGSRQKRIEYLAAAIRPWIETYIDDYGRNWRAIDARGNVAHTNSLLWTDITREAQRRNAISISEDILKEAIKLAFAWLRAAAAPSTTNNQQSPINNFPDPASRPSPLAPSPYKSLAQMDADGEIPPPAPRPSQPDTYAAAQPARAYWTPDAAPIPAGWDDADEAEYQALLPTWQKPGGEFYSINELDRITRRRVAERLSVERMDNLRFSLGERCRILWLEERRQERDASAISNQQSPISNPEAVDDSVLFDYEIDDALAELVRHANATLDGQIQSVFPGSAKYWSEQVSQTLQRPVTYQRMTLAMERLMRSLQEERAEQPGFVPIKMADDRIPRCRRLIGIYNQAISVEDEYGALTGCYSETTAPKRELQKLIDRLQRTIDLLEGKTTATAEECD